MLSVHYQRKRFTVGARMGREGNKSIIPRACSRKWAAFIVLLFCHGEEANGILFCTGVIDLQKHKCEWCSRFIVVIVV